MFVYFRVAKDIEDKFTHYEPSFVGSLGEVNDRAFGLDEHDFVPHFQRVSISGEDTSGVSEPYRLLLVLTSIHVFKYHLE